MTDNHTPEQCRRNMQAIKGKDTSIEVMLRKELWGRGLRYRKNPWKVYGHPDIAFIGKKVAVFCDSEFWHGYDWENRKGRIQTNREYWIPKIERNMERDHEVNARLTSDGWTVLRFWGKEIQKDAEGCADRVESALKGRRTSSPQCLDDPPHLRDPPPDLDDALYVVLLERIVQFLRHVAHGIGLPVPVAEVP